MSTKKLMNALFPNGISALIIIASSLLFRVTNLNLIEFKSDEAINIFLASNPLSSHAILPGGTVSSLGFLNPPIFNFILLPVAALSPDPRFISFFIAIINALTIIGFYFLIKKYYGLAAAFSSSILLSFSPWAILYSRKIWMQDLLMPFSVLLLYSIHKIVIEKKYKFWMLYGFSSLILIQLHPVSIAFIGITSLFLFFKEKPKLKYLIFGIFLAALPLIPYIIYEIQNNCPECSAFIASRGKLSAQYSLQVFIRPLQIVGIGDFRFILGDDTLSIQKIFPLIYKLRSILYLEYILLPLAILLFIKINKKLSFLGYATILTLVLYFFAKIETFMHYYIILIPLLFLFLGNLFSYLISQRNRIIKSGTIVCFLLLIIASFSFNKMFFDFIGVAGGTKGDYGTVFILSKKDTDKKLVKYKNSSDYMEIFLSSYIPLSNMYGYMPLSKMIFPHISSSDIKKLDEKLANDPDDKRIQFQILAHYTSKLETTQTLFELRQKSLSNPFYSPIYEEVLRHYLGANFKKQYIGQGHSLFYPEHWQIKELPDGTLEFNADNYILLIKDVGRVNMKITCKTINKNCDNKTILEIEESIKPL